MISIPLFSFLILYILFVIIYLVFVGIAFRHIIKVEEFTVVTSSVMIGITAITVLTLVITAVLLIGTDWQTSLDILSGFGQSSPSLFP